MNELDLSVKKHAYAVNSSSELSLTERRVANALLVHAYDNLVSRRIHEIPLAQAIDMVGFNSNNRKVLKEALEKLVSTTITWNMIEGGTESWGVSSLLSFAEIENGVCRYEYSTALAEKLHNPEIYARISLKMQKVLGSAHTLTIYEMCSRYAGFLRHRTTAYTEWMDLVSFRKTLGVDTDYYRTYKHLKQKVINKAIAEINGEGNNEGTDIKIELEVQRAGRAVSSIRFIISKNPKVIPREIALKDAALKKTGEYLQLIEAGLNKVTALHCLNEHGTEYIQEKLLLLQDGQSGHKAKNKAAFLSKAIQDDYKPNIEVLKEGKKKAEKMKKLADERILNEIAKEKVIQDQLASDKESEERTQIILKLVEELPEKTHTDFAAHVNAGNIPFAKQFLPDRANGSYIGFLADWLIPKHATLSRLEFDSAIKEVSATTV